MAPHRLLSVVKSFVQLTAEHTSPATAPAFDANHALSCAVLPIPSHSTVRLTASAENAGFEVSSILKVAVVLL